MAKKHAHRPESHRPPTSPAAARPRAARAPAQPTGARARFEAASRPLLARMRALPGFVMPALLAVAMFVGLAVNAPWAGVVLIVIALFLSWLTALSWPAITPGSRVLRVVVDLAILALGVLKVMGRL